MENGSINYSDYVYYDETSPTCLRWKVDRGYNALKDSIAGYVGYSGGSVCINNKSHSVNRVVWILQHGLQKTKYQIRHKDKDKTNVRIANLTVQVCEPVKEKIEKEQLPSKSSIYGTRPMLIFRGIRTRCGYAKVEALPYYAEATIHQEWLDNPETFYKFVLNMENYNSFDDTGKPFHIEKDLLSFNSDKYGYHPDTVCFLPRDLNQVIQLDHPNHRTVNKNLPIGVTRYGDKYKAQISSGSKTRNLGSGTIEECLELYKNAKIIRVRELTDKWKHMLSDKILNQLDLFVEHLKAI